MKNKFIFILLFLMIIFPTGVKAYGMEKFYVNATVSVKGDLEVEEFFIMNGDFNGFERVIHYKNKNAPNFDGSMASFGGSDLYNGSNIIVEKVKGIPSNTNNAEDVTTFFQKIQNAGDMFINSNYATSGDYGKYTLNYTDTGVKIKIYNPKSSVGFYVKYKIENIGIMHNDVAEIGWNIFSDEMNESIENFRMVVNIPNNGNDLRAFAHGPLTGEIKLNGKNQFTLSIDKLNERTPMDTRFVFDKSVIASSSKVSNVVALPGILAYEKGKAEEANSLREEKRQELARELEKVKFMQNLTIFFEITWSLGLLACTVFMYKKYDKEYMPLFKGKYYRDFPSDEDPEVVGYLMHHKVSNNDLSASILHLIYKKIIRVEAIPGNKKDYTFYLETNKNEIPLSSVEEKVICLLFGDKKETTLNDFQKKAKKQYSSFLEKHNEWYTEAKMISEEKNFFEKTSGSRTLMIVFGILGIFLLIFTMQYASFILIHFIIILLSVLFIVYLSCFYRRSLLGNEEYAKWKGLKNFINDFGSFKERELPQIILWEKYLVYAVTFGIAEKLAKQMELKIQAGQIDTTGVDTTIYTHNYFSTMFILNHTINQSVVNAHSSAISARDIASSSNSSSGGFGGGFSSGGGSFGGGGGGGRF